MVCTALPSGGDMTSHNMAEPSLQFLRIDDQRQTEREPVSMFKPCGFARQHSTEDAIEPAQAAGKRFDIRAAADTDTLQESPQQNDWKQESVRVAGPFDHKTGIR